MDETVFRQITEFFITVADERYRKVDDCNEIMASSDKRTDKIEKAFTESNTKLNILIAILFFIASSLVPVLIKFLGG